MVRSLGDMPVNVELLVEVAALGLAGWAALKSVPRPPDRDWERLFKVTLSTVLRGRIEARGGSAEDWEGAVLGTVLYNPAARGPETLLVAPDPATIPTPAREGERALVERLAALEGPEDRWRLLFIEDHRVLDALFEDPATLGDAHAPSRNLAPDLSWDSLAAWTEAVHAALGRRLDAVVWVTLGDDDLAEALAAASPASRVVCLPTEQASDADALRAVAQRPEERFAVVARGRAAPLLVQTLAEHSDLVDRLAAVVSLGGPLLQAPHADAVRAAFTHERLEPEVLRAVPYFSILCVDPDAPLSQSWGEQRFPDPALPPSGRLGIEVIDLGPVAEPGTDADALARALLHVVAVRHGA
jgi:hypothetical protein